MIFNIAYFKTKLILILSVLFTFPLNLAKAEEVRLPKSVSPSFYNLDLTPDLDKATFAGSEKIKLNITKSTTDITLNSSEIDIKEANLTNDKTKEKFSLTVSYNPDIETATLKAKDKLALGDYTLRLSYNGI